MPIPAKPTITPPPNDLPVRGENETSFSNKINNLVAWYPSLTDNLSDTIDWADIVFTEVETLANAADSSATSAANSAATATTQADRAEAEADEAEVFKDGAEAAAAAAQSGAGLPAIAGKTGDVLTVIGGAGSETVSFEALPEINIDGATLNKTFGAGEQYIIGTPSSTVAPIVSATVETPQAGVTNNEWETAISEQSMTVQAGLQFGANGLEIDLTGGTYVGEYLAAVTSESTNTDYWTDINSMTPDDSANGEFISYALSDDGRTTFYVVRSGEGSRPIVRDNEGVWEVNNASAFGGVDWAASPENSLLPSLESINDFGFGGYNISTASYDELNFNVSGQDSSPRGVSLNPIGTKMFIVGNANATVYQYTLANALDVSTASYDGVSFDVSPQASFPYEASFSPDGAKMFVADGITTTVYQYTLSTGHDISTASYDGVSFDASPQITGELVSLDFSETGAKLFLLGSEGVIYQYTLSTSYDLSTASYDSVSFDVTAQDATAIGIALSSSGSSMILVGRSNDSVYQYTLATEYDISTASYDGVSFSVASQEDNPFGVAFSASGNNMFVVGIASDTVYQYTTVLPQNVMPTAQLSAATDADFPAVTSSLDLAVVLRTDSAGATPTTNGVTIDYDGNVADEVAVNGADYTAQKLSETETRFTAINAGNYKVRIL